MITKEQLWYITRVYPETVSQEEVKSEFEKRVPDPDSQHYWEVAAKKVNELRTVDTSNLIEAVDKLLKFIEDNQVEDEMANDGDGYTDTWRSGQFEELINYTQEKLNEAKEVNKNG